MNKCKECPWNSLVKMCMTMPCDEHDNNPMIKLMINEINQLEYELAQVEYSLAMIESQYNSECN